MQLFIKSPKNCPWCLSPTVDGVRHPRLYVMLLVTFAVYKNAISMHLYCHANMNYDTDIREYT